MTNLLNSAIPEQNNPIYAKKLNNNSKNSVIEAPQSLFKYSIYKESEKKDTFKKNIIYDSYKKEEKKHNKRKLLILLASIASLIFLKVKIFK